MNDIILVKPAPEHEVAAVEFVAEFPPEKSIHGSYGIKRAETYSEWLDIINRPTRKYDNSPETYVPATTFFGVRESDGRIIGILDVRHELSGGLIKYVGNVGYSVRPTERKKGYATVMLKLALDYCLELGLIRALITCNKENIASARVIVKNGGLLENEIPEEGKDKIIQRYWIAL